MPAERALTLAREREEEREPKRPRPAGPAAKIVAAAAVGAFLAVLLVGMRSDIAAVERDTDAQRRLTTQLLQRMDTQTDLLRETIRLQERILANSEASEQIGRSIDAKVAQILRATEDIREDVDAMNRRTGGRSAPSPARSPLIP